MGRLLAGTLALALCVLIGTAQARAQAVPEPRPESTTAASVTQHGVTWTFDKPYRVGRFVTGDWWVIGPITIVGVSPAPGPDSSGAAGVESRSRYGAQSMRDDRRMRNGSMIVLTPDRGQGYDSRLVNYAPELSVRVPLRLEANRTLISSISNDTFPATVLHEALMWPSEQSAMLALRSAVVLTCLDEVPPADAFRPPFAGTDKPLYRAEDIRWDRLPRLVSPGEVPSWEQFERYLERPWLDHVAAWVYQAMGPVENQVNYGREASRITSIASLMVMLDVPRDRKRLLTHRLIQHGIDLHGLALAGRRWTADGGHWNGRKWPILFAGLMLGRDFLNLPDTMVFSEDVQTYYGTGWFGQTALFQIGTHTGHQPPYEERPPDTWTASNKRSEAYRLTVSGGLPGTALAVQLMGAKAQWNHDAFFDYYDRWMRQDDPYAERRGAHPRPAREGKSLDPFVDAMWAAYRSQVPRQAGARDNRVWVWSADGPGRFVANPQGPR